MLTYEKLLNFKQKLKDEGVTGRINDSILDYYISKYIGCSEYTIKNVKKALIRTKIITKDENDLWVIE